MKWLDRYKIQLVDVKWERIFLNIVIEVECDKDIQFYIASINQNYIVRKKKEEAINYDMILSKRIKINYDCHEDCKYYFSLNIAAMNGNDFLDNGQWILIAVIDEKVHFVNLETDLAYKLDDFSRIFRYGKNKYAYNCSFSLSEIFEDKLILEINSYFVIKNEKWKKRRYVQEAITVKGKLKGFYKYLVIIMIRLFYSVITFFTPKTGKNILFMTETKDYLWGNLKYIAYRMKFRGLDEKFNITYSCRKSVGHHTSVVSWIKTVFLIAKQDYIFIDDYAPIFGFLKLSQRTKLIQVWHAGEGFKSVGYSRFGKTGTPFPSESSHKAYNYALVGSENLIKVYEEVFGIKKSSFLATGMARLDDFLDKDRINKFRKDFFEKYSDFKNKKIILFAPTFRGTGQQDAYYDYSKIDLKSINEFCGNDYIFLIKMHPFIEEKINIPKSCSDNIIDFTSYPDINELYYITDLLITDYSSNYYEYALLKKPVIFFTYDREFYELKRGVHRDVKSHAPGKVCDTFDELMDALKNKDYEIEKIYNFVEENFEDFDGHAADKAIDQILLDGGEKL